MGHARSAAWPWEESCGVVRSDSLSRSRMLTAHPVPDARCLSVHPLRAKLQHPPTEDCAGSTGRRVKPHFAPIGPSGVSHDSMHCRALATPCKQAPKSQRCTTHASKSNRALSASITQTSLHHHTYSADSIKLRHIAAVQKARRSRGCTGRIYPPACAASSNWRRAARCPSLPSCRRASAGK